MATETSTRDSTELSLKNNCLNRGYKMKGNYVMARKGVGDRLIGAAKGGARALDNPLVQFGIGLASPEVAGGLALARKSGLLKKISSM